ncbi:uncharacterized oxidoreductase [[Candida] jaroonii]|uniref:Uncharacterized oxidoreductase n=1 Tax=[Candida] jaroonii TaxID=467808 RepID=A0ACA9Y013_9ASCO|nr:uncharacterized oxidoreductase [[Candida] jaroonii]
MVNYLITGVSQGIGLSLVKELCKNNFVYGTVRKADDRTALNQLDPKNLKLIELDMGDSETTFEEAFKVIDEVDVVIHNAGIMTEKLLHPLVSSTTEDFEDLFRINTMGCFKVYKYIHPYLYKGKGRKKFVAISSMAADPGIIDSTKQGSSAYGVSKIAINYLIKQIAAENSKSENSVESTSLTIALHPGALRTPMTEEIAEIYPQMFKNAEEGVKNILKLIDNKNLISGGFYNAGDGSKYVF